MVKKALLSILITALAVLPSIALAQLQSPDLQGTQLPGEAGANFTGTANWAINLLLGIVGLIAVAFIIFGGFRYVTAGGNEDAAESAKTTIKNAVIGLVVVILSAVIVNVVMSALRGNV